MCHRIIIYSGYVYYYCFAHLQDTRKFDGCSFYLRTRKCRKHYFEINAKHASTTYTILIIIKAHQLYNYIHCIPM